MRLMHRPRSGLKRIEVLVLIAIGAIVVLLGSASFQKYWEISERTALSNKLMQVALAVHGCHQHMKRLPPAWGPFPPPPSGEPASVPGGTIHYWLLRYTGEEGIYEGAQRLAGQDKAPIWTLPDVYREVFPVYVSSLDPTTTNGMVMLSGATPWGISNIAANARIFGGLRQSATASAWDYKARFSTVSNGLSNTIFFATRYGKCGSGGSAWAGGNTNASFENFMTSGAFFAAISRIQRLRDIMRQILPFRFCRLRLGAQIRAIHS